MCDIKWNLISFLITKGLKAIQLQKISIISLFSNLFLWHDFRIRILQELHHSGFNIRHTLVTFVQCWIFIVMLSCQNLDKLFFLVTAVLKQKIKNMTNTFDTLSISLFRQYKKWVMRQNKKGHHQNYLPRKRYCGKISK